MKAEQTKKISLLLLLLLGLTGIAAEAKVKSEEKKDAPLEITGENTVIIATGGDSYAPNWLQYYLIKCVAKHPDAMKYTCYPKKGEKRIDRSKAPVFPIVKGGKIPAGKNAIVLGRTKNLPAEFLSKEEKAKLEEKRGSILVKRKGNIILLAKNADSPWNLNHIRIFLDKVCGVRLYAPSEPGQNQDELWLSVPKENKITVGKLNIFKKPHLAKTTFSSGGYKRNVEWLRMNTMVSEGLNLRASHTIINYFKPEKYYKTNPELYPMAKNGTRPKPIGGAWNPCFADPDKSAKIAMQEIREMMKNPAVKRRGYLSFGVMDCLYECHCPVCRKSLKEHHGNAANLWYTFLNKVAKQCQKEFPGLYLTSYNYSNINVPKGIKLEPNIAIDNVIKTYNIINPKAFKGMKDEIMKMASTGASWVTHDWNFQAATPRIYNRQEAAFLQWGCQNGMLGIYTEWSGQEYWYLCGAYYWVLRQLLSDPYQDVDTLWKQYCQDMFGDAWVDMYEFYDMFAQKHVTSDQYYVRGDWPRQEALGFDEADVARQRKLLENAIAKTKDDPMIQKRLAAIMRYFRAHELLVQAVSKPGRAYHQYTILDKKNGINKEALAFYVNDDGSKLAAFDEYYETKRTVPPDSNAEDKNSSMRFSYRNNYARALGTIINAIRREATEGVDMENLTEDQFKELITKIRKVYHANLPAKTNPERVKEIGKLMEKILWVPKGKTMPKFDGNLSDPAWKDAAPLDGWTLADIFCPSIEKNETTGKVMRVGDKLVFGIQCSQPMGIWAETPKDIKTGTRIWREAGCEFFIGPQPNEGEKAEYIQYIVNSLGSFRGFAKAKDNRKDVECGVFWDKPKSLYTIELAVPLKVDGLYDYSKHKMLTMNIMQNAFHANTFNSKERIGWAPIFYTAGKLDSRGLIFFE